MSAWRIDLPDDISVRTDEMRVGVVLDYAKRNKVNWATVVQAPYASGELMWDMYRRECELAGVKVPAAMTMAALGECFVRIDEPVEETDDGDQGDGDDAGGQDGDDDSDPPPAKS